MAQIADLLNEIRAAGIKIDITSDSRGISPGGSMLLDLIRDHRRFATLSIKSFHELDGRFENIDAYRITHLTIDNAEIIDLRRPKTAREVWVEIYGLINDRYRRANEPHQRDRDRNFSNRRPRRRTCHRPNHLQVTHSPAPPPSRADQQPSQSANADKFYRGHNSRRYKEKFRRFPDHYYQPAG